LKAGRRRTSSRLESPCPCGSEKKYKNAVWAASKIKNKEEAMIAIDFKEIEEAFFFVSSAPEYEHRAFLDRETGKIYWQSEMVEDFGELPEDIDDDRYIAIPHKKTLGLGKSLVLDFAYKSLPDEADEIEAIFRRKGAYAKFKALLDKKGALQKWYDFEARAENEALRLWCEENGIELRGITRN
jgi:hypothetical protein